ncbi:MAG: hypothetical protein EOO77_06640 [Oxalobacteraceae bacterium]|nr:MAG: hypothetical protein EOO77_06640 [Oxalobacteraceae bacterium]
MAFGALEGQAYMRVTRTLYAWAFPSTKIKGPVDRRRWKEEDRRRVLTCTTVFGACTAALLLLTYVTTDAQLHTQCEPWVVAFRLGLGAVGALLAGIAQLSVYRHIRFPRLLVGSYAMSVCVGQAGVMQFYPHLPIVVPAVVAAICACALMVGPGGTGIFLLSGLGLQHVMLAAQAEDALVLFNAEIMMLLVGVAARALQDEAQQFLMRSAMEEVERLRSVKMVAEGIAHDILNPLNFIPGSSSLVLAGARKIASASSPEDAASALQRCEKYHQVILQAVTRAAEAIEAFRRCARGTETGEAMVATDINDLVRVAASFAQADARVTTELAATGTCLTRRHELQRVVLNLIINAQQCGKQGVHVRLVSRDTAGGVIISVHDDGPGIPEDVLKRIFEPYFTTKPGGTGMGLAMAKNFAQTHGGWITAASEGGAVISLFLPRAPPHLGSQGG